MMYGDPELVERTVRYADELRRFTGWTTAPWCKGGHYRVYVARSDKELGRDRCPFLHIDARGRWRAPIELAAEPKFMAWERAQRPSFVRPRPVVSVGEGTVFVRCGRWRRYEDDETTGGSKLTGAGP